MPAWGDVLREMTKDFRVFYVETREKQSSRVKGRAEYSAEAFGRDVVALTDQLDLPGNGYILMGSSLGATSVLDGCRFLRNKPRCLVLVGPNAEFRVPRFGKVIVTLFFPPMWFILKPILKWYLKTFRLDFKHDPKQYYKYARNIDSADPWKLKKAIMNLWKYQVWDLLEFIPFPTLIIGASKDKLHIPENLQRMVGMMPDARYLDMGTNEATHQAGMVEAMREYIQSL
jgi:pimeloyl-ACP methyl ester carboxylesterase